MHATVLRLAFYVAAMAQQRAGGLDKHRGMLWPLQNAIAVGAIVQRQAADLGLGTHGSLPFHILHRIPLHARKSVRACFDEFEHAAGIRYRHQRSIVNCNSNAVLAARMEACQFHLGSGRLSGMTAMISHSTSSGLRRSGVGKVCRAGRESASGNICSQYLLSTGRSAMSFSHTLNLTTSS